MKKSVIALAIVMLTLIVSPVYAQVTLSINPTSGPPGTVVSFNISAPFETPSRECFANDVFIGNGSPYAIPAEAQGTIVFHCFAGLGGEFNERSNDAFFTVTAPQQPASITISINPASGTPPINVAVTIQTTGNANASFCTANGVQFNPPNFVVPEGAQGTFTFQCQDPQLQIFSNQVVFTVGTPGQPTQPPAQPTQPPAPSIVLPTLPDDGTCYVATETTSAVNVRQEPSTDSPIVANMNPELFYEATQFAEVGENRWYFIPVLGGWVAGFVVRATVPCADISPQTAPVDLPPEFDDCPFLHEYLVDFPPYVINSLLDAENPCDAAFDLVGDRLFGTATPIDMPMTINISQFLEDCPERFIELATALSYLMEHDFIASQTLLEAIETLGCAVDIYTALSPEFFSRDIGIGLVFVLECGIADSRAIAVGNTLAILGFNGLEIRTLSPCTLVRFTDTSPFGVQRLFDFMVSPTCGIDRTQALWHLVFANINRVSPLDILEAINRDAPASERAFCDNPRQFIQNLMDTANTVRALDPNIVPNELRDCPELADALSRWRNSVSGAGIDLPNLLGILYAVDPCETARQFLDGIPIARVALDSRTACAGVDDGGDYFITVGGEQVNSQSSWRDKLQAVRHRSIGSLTLNCDALQEQVLGFPPDRPRVCYAVSYWFQITDVSGGAATITIYTNGPSARGDGHTAEYQLINPVTRRWTIDPFWHEPRHIGFVSWIYDDTGGFGRPFVAWQTVNAERISESSWDGIVDDSLCASGGTPIVVLPEFRIDPSWFIDLNIDRNIWRIPLEIPPIPPFERPIPFPNLTEILIGLLPQRDAGAPFAGIRGDTILRDRLIGGDLSTIERTLYMALESRCEFEEYDIYQILYFANSTDDYAPEDFADLLRILPDDACDDMRQLTSGTYPLEDGTPFFLFGLDTLPFGALGFLYEDPNELIDALSLVCGFEGLQLHYAFGILMEAGISPSKALRDLQDTPREVCFGLFVQMDDTTARIAALVAQCLFDEEDTRLGIQFFLSVPLVGFGLGGPVSGIDMFARDIDAGCLMLREAIDAYREELTVQTETTNELLRLLCEFSPDEINRIVQLRSIDETITDADIREIIFSFNGCDTIRSYIIIFNEARDLLVITCGWNSFQAESALLETERLYGASALGTIFTRIRSYGDAACLQILRDVGNRNLAISFISDICGFSEQQARDAMTALEERPFSYTSLFNNLINDTERMCNDLATIIGVVILTVREIAYDFPIYSPPPPSLDEDHERAYELDEEGGEVRFGDGESGRRPPSGAREDDVPEVIITDEDEALLRGALAPPSDTPPTDTTTPSDTPPAPRIIFVTDTSAPRNEQGVPVQLAGLPTDPQAAADFINASGLVRTGFTVGVVQIDEEGTSNIYLLVNGELELLSGDLLGASLLPAISPTGNFIAFYLQSEDGTFGLHLADISQGTPRIIQIDIGDFDLLPAVMAWTPDGADLLISVMDNRTGTPSIYALEGMPNPSNWRMVVQNGASPAVESGGRYMAFIRDGSLFSVGVGGGTARFVHDDEQACANPAFGADPFVLYFTCGNVAYRYDSSGVNALPLPNVTQITTGGINGIITFSDGETLFIAVDDGSQPQPLIRQADANVRYFNWLR